MPKVRILPEMLSNKIAAGEVVERPASVIKELIENAIDAESSKILVEIKKGGMSFIRVSDNGIGMSRDDAMLAMERHATSKIKRDTDLFSIKTLGFRGEAIPSIASVSKFSMISREKHDKIATKIESEGGKIQRISDYGAPPGVMITVRNLFFNTPARQKFLKSVNTEITRIADVVVRIALARPDIAFKLIHNKRTIKDWPNSYDSISRINDVLGNNLRKQLLTLRAKTSTISIEGWIANPKTNRTTSKGIYLFVNGRYVKDKIVNHSLISAYKGKLMKGKYPIAIIFMKVPYDQVDVNVHPSKYEVRFLNQNQIHDFVSVSIRKTLNTLTLSKWSCPANNNPLTPNVPSSKPKHENNIATSIFIKNFPKNTRIHQTKHIIHSVKSGDKELSKENLISETISNYDEKQSTASNIEKKEGKPYVQSPLWKGEKFSDLRIIGQYHCTYIICENKEDLIIIDQHAAHERIVYEQLKSSSARANPVCQNLLLPELIEMNFTGARILKKLIPHLNNYGLKVEPFGGNTFIIKTVPVSIKNSKISAMIMELVEKTDDIGIELNVQTVMQECLSIIACHNSIRGKQHLNSQEIKSMMLKLDACNNPSHCPHGRPTWIKVKLSSFGEKFGRLQ